MNNLARTMGGDRNAKLFQEILSKDKQFKNAIETPIGKEILSDVMLNMKRLTETIMNEEDDKHTRSELRCYGKILKDWSAKINGAIRGQAKLNEIKGE